MGTQTAFLKLGGGHRDSEWRSREGKAEKDSHGVRPRVLLGAFVSCKPPQRTAVRFPEEDGEPHFEIEIVLLSGKGQQPLKSIN